MNLGWLWLDFGVFPKCFCFILIFQNQNCAQNNEFLAVRPFSAARNENTRPKTNQEVTDPKASSASGSIWRASALSGGVLEEVQEGKRPSEGSPRGLRMTVEGVLRRKGQNPDLYNTSQLISPFVMWEGPSKSRVARTNRPNHMGGNANPGQIKHFVPEVLHFWKLSS